MRVRISGSSSDTAELLMGIKGAARRIRFDSKRDRFNIPHSLKTSIRRDLNANYIKVNGENIAIATQYPYHHQLEAHLQLLVDNRTPVLVVLASNKDIVGRQMPDYFSVSGIYGAITVTSTLTGKVGLTDSIEAKTYNLNIEGYQTNLTVPVIHVHNWPDHHTITPENTEKLISMIESVLLERISFYTERKSRALSDPDKLLPVVHCRAGVGRTGQTIAAMAMRKHPKLSLASITKDLRASRNDYMIQTTIQMETLVQIDLKTKNKDFGVE